MQYLLISLLTINSVFFSDVKIDDLFWNSILQRHRETTLDVCIDQIEQQTGRIRNFDAVANGGSVHSGIYFDDSDVYKALEGMAYSLCLYPDSRLEQKCDEWIDKIARAQRPDGYLNTYYTITGLQNRWTDMDMHEMYCAGHLIEGAVAYYQATGKRKLLDVAIRLADHILTEFGPGKRHWVPGHEEIELALVKLYKQTGDKRYLDGAKWLLEERGHGYGRNSDDRQWDKVYHQDDMPVKDMHDIGGHAVRAMYLYCGMADVAACTQSKDYINALTTLWEDVVLRNMYITGGIGSSRHNEGFTKDYDLPNKEAYCETCASVGMVLWNWRMNQMSGDAKYIDILERSLYNGVLAGYSLRGDKFFYVNPLESDGGHHRQSWYGCACCPSQICRFIPSVGNYIYGKTDDAFFVNLFVGSSTTLSEKDNAVIHQTTGYPWNGDVNLSIQTDKRFSKAICLRIPQWCHSYRITVNNRPIKVKTENGYAIISRKWKNGDTISLSLDMPVELVFADSQVSENKGKCAIQRGPIVYCMEEQDNSHCYDNTQISRSTTISHEFRYDMLNGVEIIKTNDGTVFVPYYSWDNRKPCRMKVWLPYNTSR